MGPQWTGVRNLLCVRFDALSEVLMTTPALRALKETCADCRLTMLTLPSGAQAARLVPEIDAVIRYDGPAPTPASPPVADAQLLVRLRQSAFDAAIVFSSFGDDPSPAATLCYVAGIPRRLAHCRRPMGDVLTHAVADPEPEQCLRHEVRRQLDLVAAVGCRASHERLSLRVPDQAIIEVTAALQRRGVDRDGHWVVIHPGAEPACRWPVESFAALARALAVDHGYRIVFAGAEADRERIEQIRTGMGTISDCLAGYFDVAHLAALICLAPMVIAGSSPAVHLATAVGTPVVAIYALTTPQRTPWASPHRTVLHDVPCKYCYRSQCAHEHHDCMRLIKPETVLDAVLELAGRPSHRADAAHENSAPAAPRTVRLTTE